jgi:hypothetical protein
MPALTTDPDFLPDDPDFPHTCISGPLCGYWTDPHPVSPDDPCDCGHASCEAKLDTWCPACLLLEAEAGITVTITAVRRP